MITTQDHGTRTGGRMRDAPRAKCLCAAVAALGLAFAPRGETAEAEPPGVIVDRSPDFQRVYVGCPALAILPDGRYAAGHSWFGPGTGNDTMEIFNSADRGATWRKTATLKGQWWSSLFVHRGALYILGVDRQYGRIVIRRSSDGGTTWTEPRDATTGLLTAEDRYHGAPVPVAVHGGRIWRAFELARGGDRPAWSTFVMSAPEDADLLQAANWRASEKMQHLWSKSQWIEGNVIAAPDGSLVNVLRSNVDGRPDRAAIVHIDGDGVRLSHDRDTDLIDFPGGGSKFTIRFDPVTRRYWTLANRQSNPPAVRNVLALTSSADLRNWTVREIVLQHPDTRFHAWQYVDWVFDGDDLAALSRTAWDGSHNYHDANYLTFHRIANFRAKAATAAGAPSPAPAVTVSSAAAGTAFPARTLAESGIPVRPGGADGAPFWNRLAVQFQFAPAFELPEIPGAKSYRFTIEPATGAPLAFTAGRPTMPLSAVWTSVSPGAAKLSVQALDAAGAPLGEPAHRAFHRAVPFGGDYPPPAMTWQASASTALTALVHSPDLRCWFTTGEPDPKVHLYRYPSKIVGAAAAALAVYASQTPPPPDAADALQAARRAADYVIAMSQPAGAAWAFHPPTYHPTLYGEWMKNHMDPGHYMTTCGAETGQYYLDVHAATKDAKYLEAAVRIAETYAKRQLPEGSWLLFVTPGDGKPLADNLVVPTGVIAFLARLGRVTGDTQFDAVRERALDWTLRNPARTWNWQGQFEDVKPMPPYENLTQHEAGDLAIHLFDTARGDAAKQALALDLMRFTEDQFVMWAQPPAATPLKQNDDGKAGARPRRWMLPCVVEQYRCYAPVVASSAKMMRIYLAAWRATGDRLHLEKARALAGTLTRAQTNPKAPGRYQTWLMQPPGPMWFNCELIAIRAMQQLAEAEGNPAP